jgi:CubicO group peptidase (beta-lactamase class C family)
MRSKMIAALFVCLIVFQAAWAQAPGEVSYSDSPVLPEGRRGERIRAVIDTVNSGSPERIREFINRECAESFRKIAPMDEHISVFLQVYRETGGMEFSGIRTYVPERKGQTVVILKDRNFDSWRAFTIRFADPPSFLISGLGFNIARPPAGPVEPPLTEEQVVKETNALVSRLIEKGVFSGTLLIAKGEKVLLTMVGGEASKRFHVPNNIDTKFNLGSMNKMFTSTSIARLVEQGKLSYDDPISRFIDESWLPRSVTEKITIHHLLTHSSGLGSYFNETYQKSSRELFRKLDDYKPLIRDDRPAFEPGQRFQYSNTGMFLLGVVIEKVTGEDYFDHIRKAIYEPAGMANTDCYEMDYPVENLAIGYSPDWKSPYGWQNNLYKHVIKGGPAGGGFSTVVDLHRFALALLSGKLVSKETLKTMWTDYLGANYGYGFKVAVDAAGKVVGHGGGFDGINSNLDIFLDSDFIVAVMSNVDMGASPLARKIGQLLGRVKAR